MIFCIKQPIPLDPCFLTAGTIVSAELNSIPIPYQNSCCNVLTSDAEEKASESLLLRQREELLLASPESGCALWRAILLSFELFSLFMFP